MDHSSSSTALTADDLIQQFPKLSAVIDPLWIRRVWPTEHERLVWYWPWWKQLEDDLTAIEQHVPLQKLIASYRSGLRDLDQLQQTGYEIHGAGLFAATASRLDLHVPLGDGSGKNFDIQAEIAGTTVNADVKTRDDDFLSPRFQRHDDLDGLTGFFRERPVIDPNEAAALGLPVDQRPRNRHREELPEATKLKARLEDALAQLPPSGVNLVLLGHVMGDRRDLDRALDGTIRTALVRNRRTGKTWLEETPIPTGAFGPGLFGEPYRRISGVLWLRLMTFGGDRLYRAYKLYVNEYAMSPLPEAVRVAIEEVLASLTELPAQL